MSLFIKLGQAAAKYASKTKARKHLDDLTGKPTRAPTKKQAATEKATQGQRTYRAGQRRAAGGGVTAAAAVDVLSSAKSTGVSKSSAPVPRPRPTAAQAEDKKKRAAVASFASRTGPRKKSPPKPRRPPNKKK